MVPPTSFGATAGASLSDVSTSLVLQVEWSRHFEQWVHGLALERNRCFDLLLTEICIEQQRHAGCPESVQRVREDF